MGYTHYMRGSRDFTDSEWSQIQNEAKQIFDRADGMVADPQGTPGTKPVIDDERIVFNGVGKDAYETASVEKSPSAFECCKTNYRPYDPVVVELYAVVKQVAPDAVEISSDGGDIVFEKARQERFARQQLTPGSEFVEMSKADIAAELERKAQVKQAEVGSKFTELSKADVNAELEKRLKQVDPPGFANIIEHAQDVANRTGKTVMTMKQLKDATFEGKVTSADVPVGKDRLATVEGPTSVLLVRSSPTLCSSVGRDVQVKNAEFGASVHRPSKGLER